jgi:transcription elongation factor GreA-like protein
MSEALLKNVQEMLNEEKWTRATLSNYSTIQFKELDAILKEAREGRFDNELKKLCDEHLVHTKNSIIALYLGGMSALSQQIIDDSAMVNLVTIFLTTTNGLLSNFFANEYLITENQSLPFVPWPNVIKTKMRKKPFTTFGNGWSR